MSVRMNKLSKTASIARFDTGSPYYYCGGNYKITDNALLTQHDTGQVCWDCHVNKKDIF